MIKYFCDICGFEIFPDEKSEEYKYKLKKASYSWEGDRSWHKVKAHQFCIDHLCEEIKRCVQEAKHE